MYLIEWRDSINLTVGGREPEAAQGPQLQLVTFFPQGTCLNEPNQALVTRPWCLSQVPNSGSGAGGRSEDGVELRMGLLDLLARWGPSHRCGGILQGPVGKFRGRHHSCLFGSPDPLHSLCLFRKCPMVAAGFSQLRDQPAE